MLDIDGLMASLADFQHALTAGSLTTAPWVSHDTE